MTRLIQPHWGRSVLTVPPPAVDGRVGCCRGRVRLTWSLSPHSPAEGVADRVPAARRPNSTGRDPLRPFSVTSAPTGLGTGRAYS